MNLVLGNAIEEVSQGNQVKNIGMVVRNPFYSYTLSTNLLDSLIMIGDSRKQCTTIGVNRIIRAYEHIIGLLLLSIK